MDFAVLALDHAADSVVASGGPLTPFSLVEESDEDHRQLTRHVCDTLEEGLAQARRKVREGVDIRQAAIAWDGYLTLDGLRTDAVFVQATNAGSSESIILAQRYMAGKKVRRVGAIVLAGRAEPLF
jgi:hypothetical protein